MECLPWPKGSCCWPFVNAAVLGVEFPSILVAAAVSGGVLLDEKVGGTGEVVEGVASSGKELQGKVNTDLLVSETAAGAVCGGQSEHLDGCEAWLLGLEVLGWLVGLEALS